MDQGQPEIGHPYMIIHIWHPLLLFTFVINWRKELKPMCIININTFMRKPYMYTLTFCFPSQFIQQFEMRHSVSQWGWSLHVKITFKPSASQEKESILAWPVFLTFLGWAETQWFKHGYRFKRNGSHERHFNLLMENHITFFSPPIWLFCSAIL